MLKQPRLKPAHRQGGYMLIASMFAIAIGSALMVTAMRHQARTQHIALATGQGALAAQFAVGLRGFMAAVQANPALLPTAARAGVDWLKPPACGGLAGNPAQGYVPCSYTGGTLGPQYQTTFTRDPATNLIEIRTTFLIPPIDGDPRSPVVNAERVVQGALANQSQPANGVFFNAFANVPAAATAPLAGAATPAAGNVGRVVMIASNAPSNDLWLRTDGTNQMLANLNMGGMSIGNARDGRFSGDVRIDRRLQVDQGMRVVGPSELEGGVVTPEIALTNIGKFAAEGIYDAQVYTGATSYTVAKPNCAAAGNNPGIYVAMQGTGSVNSAGYRGDAMYQARADVADLGGSWRITPVVHGTRFDLAVAGSDIVLRKTLTANSPADMRLLVMRRCR